VYLRLEAGDGVQAKYAMERGRAHNPPPRAWRYALATGPALRTLADPAASYGYGKRRRALNAVEGSDIVHTSRQQLFG